jgi:predicted glycogen debranching enzyme
MSRTMIQFGQEVCADLGQASSREWLETNGLGGYASSTITGMNTRRYHGLLIAATAPPCGRALLLSKLEETLVIGDERFELGTNQYPGTIHPQGYSYLKRFRLDPYPIFTFEVHGTMIEKHVCMLYGQNATVIQYLLSSDAKVPMHLEVRPLIAFRDHHATTHQNADINPNVEQARGRASVTPYIGMPTLHFGHNAASVETIGDWYHSFEFAREMERGLDYDEDLFNPLCFRLEMQVGKAAVIIASTEVHEPSDTETALKNEVDRRNKIAGARRSETIRQLTLTADQFIVNRGEQKTVIAGYHWFGDWGRDTMIALSGLTLATGRAGDARQILIEFSKHVDQGMLPNRFPDSSDKPEYNTVDATLWYFEAIRAYHSATNDDALAKELFPILVDVIDWHVKGTRYGIHAEEDGLLRAGEPGVQLTWMDAKVGDWVVTPRIGKPVEIQALWYNALRAMEKFSSLLGDHAERKRFEQMAALASASFNNIFWNDDAMCLFDVVNGVDVDPSMRPNQIFAVSLHHSMLSPDRAKKVVSAVQRELLTPFGLRTLSNADPRYIGRYAGDQRSRDGAYHQGTVWPWLIGPFIEAYIKVNSDAEEARSRASAWLTGLTEHLSEAGLGTVSEVFEGDAPHRPCGCIAQAWSVAEFLRALRLIDAKN